MEFDFRSFQAIAETLLYTCRKVCDLGIKVVREYRSSYGRKLAFSKMRTRYNII